MLPGYEKGSLAGLQNWHSQMQIFIKFRRHLCVHDLTTFVHQKFSLCPSLKEKLRLIKKLIKFFDTTPQ